jgi:hypothetical protein
MAMDDSREDIEQAQAELQRRLVAAEGWDDSCEAAAREYARLMVEAGIEQQETLCRLEAAGIAPKWAWEILIAAEKQAEEAELAGATPVCPHCLTPVGQFDHFCPKCAGPITAIASFDPMGQIYSAGRAYRLAATDKRPRGVVVLGMWLIFGPSLLSLLWALSMFVPSWVLISPGYDLIGMEDATVHAIWLILILGAFALYSAILWKVTAHWLQSRHQQADDGPEETSEQ